MITALPLVTFERYMLAEDTPEYPRNFILEVLMSGELRPAALEAAWPLALVRHPLLVARLDQQAQNWIWAADAPAPTIDWAQLDEPLAFAGSEQFDLKHEAGVRLWVRTSADQARLVFQFQHACCDGVGAFEFIGDLLALYAAEIDPATAPVLPAVRPELLAQRGTFGLQRPSLWEFFRDVAVTAAMALQQLARKPMAVNPPAASDQPQQPMDFPGIESHTFSPDQIAALRLAARQTGATVNDLMMAYLFSAIVAWNARDGQVHPRRWLRMNVPTSLRRQADEEMPAANVMSFAFIDRRAGDCADGVALVDSIRQEMDAIKRLRLSLYFIGQMGILAAIPGALRAMLRMNRCFASAVLTNVGDPTRRFRVRFRRRENKAIVGNLLLENILGVPPIRALTRVGVALLACSGQLTISILCDRHCFSREQARQFLQTYLDRIAQGLPSTARAASDAENSSHAATADTQLAD